MKIKNTMSLFMLIISMFAFSSLVNADSSNFNFVQIELNDLILFQSGSNFTVSQQNIEITDEMPIEITVQGSSSIGNNIAVDTRCSAEIDGYEYGILRSDTAIFSVEANNTYKKTLTIPIPQDIQANELYTLRVECRDQNDEDQMEFKIFLNEKRHFVDFVTVGGLVLNPSSKIGAGKPLSVTIRLENFGEKNEDDIKVTASIPELGVSTTGFIPELVTKLAEENEQFLFEEESSGQIDLLLRIPEDAQSGTYTLKVDVTYDRGHSTLTKTVPLTVEGQPVTKGVDTVINIDSTSKTASQGQEVTYRINVANLGTDKAIVSIMTEGLSPWAEARVEPGFITVNPGSTGEALIYVRPNPESEPRDYVFVTKVMMGSDILQEISMHTKVTPGQEEKAETAVGFKTVLGIVFVALVVILVILGIVIAMRKPAAEESRGAAEAQTYYYVPKMPKK